jgi:YbgC/YbaW family acyl-CoA thioester hydrolase
MTFDYRLMIRESYLDTFGHMNNATYLSLFEEARWELITRNGYGLHEVQKRKQGPVILEVNLKFMKELKLREEILIRTELLDYKSKIGQLKQQMINAKGEVASEATFTFGLFDLENRRLIPATPEWQKAIGMT